MAAQPRIVQSKSHRKTQSIPLTGLPGAIAGLAIAVVFLMLVTSMRFNTVENIMIMVLVAVMSATFFGLVAHLMGEALVNNEDSSSTTQFFHGSVKLAKLVHNLFWVLSFCVISGLLVMTDPKGVLQARERASANAVMLPEQKPIPIPPSPASGRRNAPRTLAENSAVEDPNRMKSSPSRFEKGDSGDRNPGTPAEQQTARDAMVVEALKNAGLKVDDIVYAPAAPKQ